MKERIITFQGRDVALCYCAATENGFEELSGKNIYDINFKSQRDLVSLALSAIVAAYAMRHEEPPVSTDTVLFEATPTEIRDLIAATLELRMEWYNIPKVVANQLDKEKKESEDSSEESPKN